MAKINGNLAETMQYMERTLRVRENFDLMCRILRIGSYRCAVYCISGFANNAILEKLLEAIMGHTEEIRPKDMDMFLDEIVPYASAEIVEEYDTAIFNLLSGQSLLFVDGLDSCIVMDCRSYPARSVSEPEKDKTLRGSRDGFVETLIFNAALIRRRIRDPKLTIESMQTGRSSMTDIALCYMEERIDKNMLNRIREKIQHLDVDALTMNQQSLAECLYPYKWYNPFPKFKFTERPDTAAASILEGNLVILVDNSPSAMVLPSSVFDIVEEADDYYFPPITGTYLRFSRLIISLFTLWITPVWLLLIQNPQWLPPWLEFIKVKEVIHVPLILQLLLLELAIDGLRLAAVNTPNMLTTPLSVMAALVLGEFSVKSGWFNSEPLLYMAFVSVANYTQSSFELGYAVKFMRIITLILTALFNVWGFAVGQVITILAIVTNKTITGHSYLYPLIPFSWKTIKRRLLRVRLRHGEK
ncbi:MAG TPA: spore germination protein [Candidatus Fimimorpha excrementavium]|nr:spore germination protein [Candidatus Fimimorpha excrementavium]